jgi:hypothetical protein
VPGLRTRNLQRAAADAGVVQAKIQHVLAFGQPLGGRGLQGLQFGVIVGRTEMLDAT